ncbi:uncharacterized protein LOC131237063 [Magnolia sinica]|uniref:uncharacterized protein LOC131237063 n=1 Tax=Magnolia sinica TaxID=86752 RepID=UPI00265B4CD5|nr:uncharacterized protein LOC131237063 [Magnolia sinica]
MKKKFYVVFVERKPGIYESWEECKAQVHGFCGCKHKSFTCCEDAMIAWNQYKAIAIDRATEETPGGRHVSVSSHPAMVDSGTFVEIPIEQTITGDIGSEEDMHERVATNAVGNEPVIDRPLVAFLLGLFILFVAGRELILSLLT